MSMVLVFSMLFSGASVYAGEPVAAEDDFVVVATAQEDIGNGVTMTTELSVLKEDFTVRSFVGSKTGRVEHKYTRNGSTVSSIIMYAVFRMEDGRCDIIDYNYSVNNYSGILDNIEDVNYQIDAKQTILGSDVSYSKYTVSYDFGNAGTGYKGCTLWVRCDSNGKLTTSGNKTHTLSIDDELNVLSYQF